MGMHNYYQIATNISLDAKKLNWAVMTIMTNKLKLLRQQLYDRSIEYADNRISLYSAQKGYCAVTGEKFTATDKTVNLRSKSSMC